MKTIHDDGAVDLGIGTDRTPKPVLLPGVSDLFSRMPRQGEIWEHTASGKCYRIEGSTYNSITDQIEVSYAPCYPSEFDRFNRQLIGHPKAWLSYTENGAPRFRRIDDDHPTLNLGD